MGAIHEIAKKLADAGHGTIGTSLFRDEMPDTSVITILLRQTGGAPPEYRLGTPVPYIERPTFAVDVRGIAGPTSVTGPRNKAQAVWDTLAAVQAETLAAGASPGADVTTAFYHWIVPLQPPYPLSENPDEKGRRTYRFNITVEKEKSVLV